VHQRDYINTFRKSFPNRSIHLLNSQNAFSESSKAFFIALGTTVAPVSSRVYESACPIEHDTRAIVNSHPSNTSPSGTAYESCQKGRLNLATIRRRQGKLLAIMEAQCQCGSVKFKTPTAKPLALYICHCESCRRQTGSAFGTSAIFPRFPIPVTESLSCYTYVFTLAWVSSLANLGT
jgi:hypothetical protein